MDYKTTLGAIGCHMSYLVANKIYFNSSFANFLFKNEFQKVKSFNEIISLRERWKFKNVNLSALKQRLKESKALISPIVKMAITIPIVIWKKVGE